VISFYFRYNGNMSSIKEVQQESHGVRSKRVAWIDITLLILLMAYILSGTNLAPFHGDESTFISMSTDYDRIMKDRNFSHVLFDPEGSAKQHTRLSIGSILVYSIGFARDINHNAGSGNRWLWGSSWEENVEKGHLPDPQLLHIARLCSVLLGALSLGVFFITALQLFSSRMMAWAATLILATHGDILVNFRRAMQEGPKFLFLMLTLYIAALILVDLKDGRMRRYLYACLGVGSGLCLAAKQDTAIMLIAIYCALALLPIWKKETLRSILINVLYLGAATILAYASFLAFMPVFWSWWESAFVLAGFAIILLQIPLWKSDRAAKWLVVAGSIMIIGMTLISPTLWGKLTTPLASMIETRQVMIRGQVNNSPNPLVTPGDKLAFLLRTTFTSRVMYMEASSFDVPPFHEQIASYENSFTSGRTGSRWADGLILILAILGGWALQRQFNAESLLIYSLLIITGILLFVTVPLPWQRYFLIMQIPYSLIAGVGAGRVLEWGEHFFT
jgi:4-amino-4-deoxy-L-arabinose transferase-like glycosyltransferase